MRFEYLQPAQGEVITGLEEREKIYALEQGEYLPIRTLPAENGNSSIYRCELSPLQRQMIADGADVLIEILHLRGPLAPTRLMLVNQTDMDEDERKRFTSWLCAQVKMPESS